MVYLKAVASVALIISIAWLLAKPGYDSGVAVFGSLATLIAAFIAGRKRHSIPRQQQDVSKSSVGIQAGGDVSVGSIFVDKVGKNVK
jgi:hypothetical protein